LYLSDNGFYYSGGYNLAPGLSAVYEVASGVSSALAFYTYASAGGRNERMRILSNGNVGIGNTGPVQKLDVTGAIQASSSILAASGAVQMGNPAGSYYGIYSSGGAQLLYYDGSAVTPALSWDSNGLVTVTKTLKAAAVYVNTASSATPPSMSLTIGNNLRWAFTMANAESSGNAGSDLVIYRYNDAGASLGIAFQIVRSSGLAYIAGDTQLNGNLQVTNLPSASPGAGSKKLWYDPADSNRVKFAV